MRMLRLKLRERWQRWVIRDVRPTARRQPVVQKAQFRAKTNEPRVMGQGALLEAEE